MRPSQIISCLILALLFVISGIQPVSAEAPPDPKTDPEQKRDNIRLKNLSQITLALRHFDDQHGHFPTRVRRSDTGKPLLSWRVALLPYLGHDALHRQFRFDEPWDSEHNRKLIRQMPDVFDVGAYTAEGKDAAAGYTHVVVPVMKGSLWHDDQPRTIYDVHDGAASTLAVFAAPPDAAVAWTKPGDLSLNPTNIEPGMFGERQICLMATLDGARFRIAKPASNADLKALITVDGREEVVWNNFMPWLKTRRTSSLPSSLGALSDKTTDVILAKRLTRREYLTDLTSLNLTQTRVTAAGLRHLKGLPALKRITLNDSQTTDTALEHLAGVPTLESLDLRDSLVTDAGLKHIAKLTNLKRLLLDRTKITDAGLAHIKGFTALEQLWLSNTNVTDAGLENLRRLTNLNRLHLSGTDVTDAGLEHLQGLRNLEVLFLNRTTVAGPGLQHLRGLMKLKTLHLIQTSMNDAGLEHLKGSGNLTSINVWYTQVSADAARELKATMAQKCSVSTRVLDPSELANMQFGSQGRSGAEATYHEGIWKLYARSPSNEIDLFDLSKDLQERHNVATDHPEVKSRLLAELRSWVLTLSHSSKRTAWIQQHGTD